MPDSIREQFDERGFVIIEDFFDPCFVQEIDRELERYVIEIVPGLPANRVFRESENDRAIRSANQLDIESEFFSRFKHHEQSVELAAEIFGVSPEEIVSESLQFFGKPAFEGSVTPWHQDNGFQHYDPPESLMLWLALADVDEDMGCVVFASGSHKLGLVDHVPSGVLGFSQTVAEEPDPDTHPEVKATMRRGSVSLHHCNTFHRSGPNKTSRARPALSVNYRTTRALADVESRVRVKREVDRLIGSQVQRNG